MPDSQKFFRERSEQSRVKAMIVSKYFTAWARVMVATQKRTPVLAQKIAYVDLFCGPGQYADGTSSTPLLVLEKAIEDSDIRSRLITIFNDKDAASTISLQDAISQLPGIHTLSYRPKVLNLEIGEDIVSVFEQTKVIPTLFFVDPFGYRGLSLKLIGSVLKNWGCDCIFFFNYRRINMGLNNPAFSEHMDALFGEERAVALRKTLGPLAAHKREMLIVEEICQAIREAGSRFVLPFCFKDDRGTRTSHHLIFVSKHFRGYEIMKEIMAKEGIDANEGVPSFEYNPVDADCAHQQPFLFKLSRPLEDLAGMLLVDFAGQSLTMHEIYETHNVDKPYIKKNYKEALKMLEKEGKISASSHKKGSFADSVKVKFPIP